MNPPATASHETPVFFPAGEESLFGIVTEPSVAPLGQAVIMLAGGGLNTSVNRNRLWVILCRRLAAQGYHTMRFDYHGVGESTGAFRQRRFAEPFVEDVEGAVRHLRGMGIDRFIIVGSCFGARTALAAAPGIEGVEGVVLVAAPVSDLQQGEGAASRGVTRLGLWAYLRRGFQWRVLRRFMSGETFQRGVRRIWIYLRVWVRTAVHRLRPAPRSSSGDASRMGTHFIGPLEEAVGLRIPLLFVYGREDPYLRRLEEARSGSQAGIFQRAGALIEVSSIEGVVNPQHHVGSQGVVIDLVTEWLARLRGESKQEKGVVAKWTSA